MVLHGRKVPLDLELSSFGENNETDLINGLQAITKKLKQREKQVSTSDPVAQALPNVITFPYSRHSSYPELRELVNAFKPRDVWPCTVDLPAWLSEGKIPCVSAARRLLTQFHQVLQSSGSSPSNVPAPTSGTIGS